MSCARAPSGNEPFIWRPSFWFSQLLRALGMVRISARVAGCYGIREFGCSAAEAPSQAAREPRAVRGRRGVACSTTSTASGRAARLGSDVSARNVCSDPQDCHVNQCDSGRLGFHRVAVPENRGPVAQRYSGGTQCEGKAGSASGFPSGAGSGETDHRALFIRSSTDACGNHTCTRTRTCTCTRTCTRTCTGTCTRTRCGCRSGCPRPSRQDTPPSRTQARL